MSAVSDLLARGPIAVNLGVRDFAESLRAQRAEVIEVDWFPPAEGDEALLSLLDKIL